MAFIIYIKFRIRINININSYFANFKTKFLYAFTINYSFYSLGIIILLSIDSCTSAHNTRRLVYEGTPNLVWDPTLTSEAVNRINILNEDSEQAKSNENMYKVSASETNNCENAVAHWLALLVICFI